LPLNNKQSLFSLLTNIPYPYGCHQTKHVYNSWQCDQTNYGCFNGYKYKGGHQRASEHSDIQWTNKNIHS
jgi:hypothetical protein